MVKLLSAKISSGLRRWSRAALAAGMDALLPCSCLGCAAWLPNDRDEPLCAACAARLRRLACLPFCRRCARTLPTAALREDDCGLCGDEKIWNTAGITRIGPYLPPLEELVKGLKYLGRRGHAALLGRLLGKSLQNQAWLGEVELLLPVPMHPLRRAQRPVEHALDLARAVGDWVGVPVAARAVVRTRYTPSQTLLETRHARRVNVHGCFEPRSGRPLEGRIVCIIDNMMTVGWTLHEVAKAARRGGARRVYAAVAARSVLAADFQADPDAIDRGRTGG